MERKQRGYLCTFFFKTPLVTAELRNFESTCVTCALLSASLFFTARSAYAWTMIEIFCWRVHLNSLFMHFESEIISLQEVHMSRRCLKFFCCKMYLYTYAFLIGYIFFIEVHMSGCCYNFLLKKWICVKASKNFIKFRYIPHNNIHRYL